MRYPFRFVVRWPIRDRDEFLPAVALLCARAEYPEIAQKHQLTILRAPVFQDRGDALIGWAPARPRLPREIA